VAVGRPFRLLIAFDALVVLCGGVLTSYIGVIGLVERLALDRCLPHWLTVKNRFTHTSHFAILGFFGLTASLYAIVQGSLASLGGVFAVSFLSVMCMFAMGNLALKFKRPRLPRPISAHWALVLFGLCAMLSGLIGNIIIDPEILKFFAIYFFIPMTLIFIYFEQIRLMKMLLFIIEATPGPLKKLLVPLLSARIRKMKEMCVIFFTKTDEIHILNKAVLYAHNNELCDRVKIVHFYDKEENIPKHLLENHFILDHLYPKIQIDLHLMQGHFCPEVIPYVSESLKVGANFMYVRCPGPNFRYSIGSFKGVRIIMA